MAETILTTSILKNDEYPKCVDVEAANCCGAIKILVDNSFTEQMAHELPNITINIYTDSDGEQVLYTSRALAISVPEVGKPIEDVLIDIPEVCTLAIQPEFDNNALLSHNNEVKISGGELWTTPTTEFPITLVWDDTNIYAESGGGGGSGSGDTSRYTIEKVTASSGEATFKLMESIDGGASTAVGDVIAIRGSEMLVTYGTELTILDTTLADIKDHMDATYNFTTFTELEIDTQNKTLKQITDELYALDLPTNTIVTGQLYSSALPFSGNGEAEVMINSPAYWWKCTSLNVAPYSWNAIAGGGAWSGVIMDWTPTYINKADQINYDNTTSGATATNVQNVIDELYSTLGDINSVLEGVL